MKNISGVEGWAVTGAWGGAAALGALLAFCNPCPAQRAFAARDSVSAPAAVARAIDDPSSGTRWLLLPDSAHPGGPGKLVPAQAFSRSGVTRQPARRPEKRVLVVRAGDPLCVEEHTPTADVRLQAVALEPAFQGQRLHVRLQFGGAILRVEALRAGEAELIPSGGEQ